MQNSYTYIITNKKNGTLYIGVTSNLVQRIFQHKEKLVRGFSAKYGLEKLVYFEVHQQIEEAILREKKLKRFSRKKKIELIEEQNRHWIDLYDSIL